MGDSWGALAVPYLLAKYVFPRMEHVGWTGLHEAALLEKSRPYSLELRANWARLKVAHVREGTGNGRCLKKDRWCDTLLFRAQDACMADSVRVNWAVQRLAVMGFVKVTCSRAGAMARDWADRAGLQVRVCVARLPQMLGDVVGARSAFDWYGVHGDRYSSTRDRLSTAVAVNVRKWQSATGRERRRRSTR